MDKTKSNKTNFLNGFNLAPPTHPKNLNNKSQLTISEVSLLCFVLLIIFILQISPASAIGITPGRTTFDFAPGLTQVVNFSIVNTEHKDMNVVFFVRGDMNESVALSDSLVKISANEDSRHFSYKFTLPNKIGTPGKYVTEIVAMELPEDLENQGNFVGATVAVASQLYIYVPYPNKYLEGDVNIINDDTGKVVFFVPLTSRGDLDIVNARAIIDVYTPLNEKVATIETDSMSLPSLGSVELAAEWQPNVNPGKYLAVVTIIYDNQDLELHKEFNIGESLVDIEEVSVNDFHLGEIAKFNALVNNKWSGEIKDAFLNILVYNKDNQVMADFKSPTYDLAALSKSEMVLYWDTAGVHIGTYDGKLLLKYGDKSTEKNIQLKITDSSIEISGLTGRVVIRSSGGSGVSGLLVIGLIVLVLINVIWFFIVRRLMKRRKK